VTAAPFLSGAAWFELALRGTLLIGAAWLAAAALRRAGASAATRHMAWLLGIAALLALPLLWWLLPPLRLPVLRPEAVTVAASSFPLPALAATPSADAGGPGWEAALLAAWLLGVALVLLRFASCRHLVARLWGDAEPAGDTAWQDMLSRVRRELGLSRPVALRIARGPAMPMTWGTLAPKVLLPAEACAWPPDRRRLVLLHELAHVARRDSFSRSAASLACALYWFHPGVWLAARRLRLEQEYAADDRVLSAGAAPRSYAASLLDLARRVGEQSRPDHAAAMAGMCQLEQRLVSITTPAQRGEPGLIFLSAAVAIATALMLSVATGTPVRPLPSLSDPLAIETRLGASPIRPLTEDTSAPMQVSERGAAAPRAEGGLRDARDGLQLQRAGARPPQPDPRAQDIAAQPPALAESPPPPASEAQDNPPPRRQLAAYGPQLPQPIAEEQESDPRIPAALRGEAGRRATHANRPPSQAASLLRFLPRFALEASGVLPPG